MSLMLRRFAPSNDLLGVHRLNALLDDAFSGWPGNGVATSAWLPAVDVFEDKESLKIVAELPGLKPEDVKITMENNTLTLRGEKKQVAEEKSERVHRYERSYGTLRAVVHPAQHPGGREGGRLVRERGADDHPAQGREGEAAGDCGGGRSEQ